MTLEECRQFYVEEIRYAANITSPELIAAFARVQREEFLGPGPWRIGVPDLASGSGGAIYRMTEDSDPRHVYHNVSIALDSTRNLCNGQPGTLAYWLQALQLKTGDRTFHLGCGVGYYTAIMAEVVGTGGSVVASEVDPDLTSRATKNLAIYSQVEVHGGDGAALDPGFCDAMLINAGVTHPHISWLQHLREGGRMILPLTMAMGTTGLGKGVMARIVRQPNGFSAEIVTFVAIYSCSSARDPELEPLIGKALSTGALLKMKSVRCGPHDPDDSCMLHARDVCVSSAAL